jgi:hypothetical protein
VTLSGWQGKSTKMRNSKGKIQVPFSIAVLSLEKATKYELYFLLGRAYQKTAEWDQAIETLRGIK